jgi:hypothetical protein
MSLEITLPCGPGHPRAAAGSDSDHRKSVTYVATATSHTSCGHALDFPAIRATDDGYPQLPAVEAR